MTEAEGLIERLRSNALVTYLGDGLISTVPPTNAPLLREAVTALQQAISERDRAQVALGKINGIRNSIIGLQTMNWSEHIYPLVAALNEAGIEGMHYPEARENFGTMLERTNAAEAQVQRLTASLEDAGTFTLVGWRYRYDRMGDGQPWHFSLTDPGELQDGYVKEPIYIKGRP